MKLLLSALVAVAFPWWTGTTPATPCQVPLAALHADVPLHSQRAAVSLQQGFVAIVGVPSRHRYVTTTAPGRYTFHLVKGDWRLLISTLPARGDLTFQPCRSAQRVGNRAAVERLDIRVHP